MEYQIKEVFEGQNKTERFEISLGDWHTQCDEILAVRHKVFMIEQHFTESRILRDLRDDRSIHLVVRNYESRMIACGRITQKGRIGKIAVLLPYRGLGIGSRILQSLVDIGKQNGLGDLSLNAELDGRRFFDKQKFNVAGPVFMKQGIPHQMLARKIA